MALGINTIWECRTSATASNVNGAGFNPENVNFLTDLTTDTNTGNTSTPIVSSVSYNFSAGDVNAYVFIKSGTNWLPGWYKITSVASNKATLSAAVGAMVWYTSGANRSFALSTSAGVATVGTPTSGTFTIDYTQQDANIISLSDLACTTPSTTVTSATGSFSPVMVGNIMHINTAISGAGGLTGWFEIVSYTNATTVVLDRTPSPSTSGTTGAFRVGGAASLNTAAGATDDSFFENGLGTNASGAHIFFIKNGTFGSMSTVTLAASGGTQAPIRIFGYNTLRTDGMSAPLVNNRPTLAWGASTFNLGTNWEIYNIISTGTAAACVTVGQNGKARWCKFVNSSTTAARTGLGAISSGGCVLNECEAVSYKGNGIALSTGTGNTVFGCYVHDSDTGILLAQTNGITSIINNIVSSNVTYAIRLSTAITGSTSIIGNTLYGSEGKIGTGISMITGVTNTRIEDNIIYGFSSGIVHADVQFIGSDDYNDFFNNTTDVSNWTKGSNDVALSPQFVSATEVSGNAGTSSTNVLTDGVANFSSVVDNQDFLVITSGTGTGLVTLTKLLITSHTSTTLTVSSNITTSGSGSSLVYFVSLGHNYAIGTNLKAKGYPGLFPGSLTTGYLDIGGVQRQEAGGGSGGSFTFS